MRKYCLILLIQVITMCSLANDPIKELIRNAGDASTFPDDNILVVFDSTLTNVMETGLTYVSNHVLYKILTTTGAKELNVLTFSYDPQSAFVEIQRTTVYKKNGEVVNLDQNTVMDYHEIER